MTCPLLTHILDRVAPADADGTRWFMRFNPCDLARYRVLAPIGDALAAMWRLFTYGTDCPCCLATRLIVLAVILYLL